MPWLPPPDALLPFLAATLLLAASPGPGVFYILARSLALGRRAGWLSALAVAAGNLASVVLAVLGLAALLAVSALAFSLLKGLGAAYLVWLGVQALRRARSTMGTAAAPPPADTAAAVPQGLFRDGVLVALLNPKTALFHAAFLPQFVQPGAAPQAQMLALGLLFVLVALATDLVYVGLATTLRRRWAGRPGLARAGHLGSALVLMGLGAWALMAERPRG